MYGQQFEDENDVFEIMTIMDFMWNFKQLI
jgi:hypothetical protein